jgi:hypothetical protein
VNSFIAAIGALGSALGTIIVTPIEWVTDRWYRVASYFGAATLINTVGLFVDFSWYWFFSTMAFAAYGSVLTYLTLVMEHDMRARVEEALADVDFNDMSRWIGPEDQNYPKRPQR